MGKKSGGNSLPENVKYKPVQTTHAYTKEDATLVSNTGAFAKNVGIPINTDTYANAAQVAKPENDITISVSGDGLE